MNPEKELGFKKSAQNLQWPDVELSMTQTQKLNVGQFFVKSVPKCMWAKWIGNMRKNVKQNMKKFVKAMDMINIVNKYPVNIAYKWVTVQVFWEDHKIWWNLPIDLTPTF